MASQVQIANRALTKIGEGRITALSDDLEPARVIDSLWDIVRDSELRIRRWKFSLTRTTLAALSTTPSWGFDNEFQLPSDCLRLLQVNDVYPGVSLSDYRNMDEAEWRVEGRKILTNHDAPLKIRYIQRVTDTGSWDAAFTEAFACRLAIETVERLARTDSSQKRQLAWDEYKQAIRMALTADAIEAPPEPIPDTEWVLTRL